MLFLEAVFIWTFKFMKDSTEIHSTTIAEIKKAKLKMICSVSFVVLCAASECLKSKFCIPEVEGIQHIIL